MLYVVDPDGSILGRGALLTPMWRGLKRTIVFAGPGSAYRGSAPDPDVEGIETRSSVSGTMDRRGALLTPMWRGLKPNATARTLIVFLLGALLTPMWRGLKQTTTTSSTIYFAIDRSAPDPDVEGIETCEELIRQLLRILKGALLTPMWRGLKHTLPMTGSRVIETGSAPDPDVEGIETRSTVSGQLLEAAFGSAPDPDVEGIETSTTSGRGWPSLQIAGSAPDPDVEGIETVGVVPEPHENLCPTERS